MGPHNHTPGSFIRWSTLARKRESLVSPEKWLRREVDIHVRRSIVQSRDREGSEECSTKRGLKKDAQVYSQTRSFVTLPSILLLHQPFPLIPSTVHSRLHQPFPLIPSIVHSRYLPALLSALIVLRPWLWEGAFPNCSSHSIDNDISTVINQRTCMLCDPLLAVDGLRVSACLFEHTPAWYLFQASSVGMVLICQCRNANGHYWVGWPNDA